MSDQFSRREWLKAAASLAAAPSLRTMLPSVVQSRPAAHSRPSDKRSVTFVDVAPSAGIHFVHCNAASSEKYLIETMGAGCGWIDFNQDGLLDLYLVNGAATRLYAPRQPLRSSLYSNIGD